ncbi:MAG: DUF1800 domain-containing protein [Bacteroidota bacterium]
MANASNQTQIQHLHLRAGFGQTISIILADSRKSIKAVVKQLFKDSLDYVPLRVVEENSINHKKLKEKSLNSLDDNEKDELREEIKMLVKESKTQIKELNLLWLDRMANGSDSLRQKMTLFWHGHFACKSRNAFFTQQYFNTLQQHSLGSFGELLHAISKSPAMLQFLNNQQNRKNNPNENFAREVMELFTLGRGNYTEADIKNAARAFTGWGFTQEGEYIFRKNQHDNDSKTFFGKAGNFIGEDIIEMILKRKETAFFISQKIYQYFVNEKVDPKRIQNLADRFYKSGYDIKDLMEYIFTADWFYEPQNIGVRIKSPLELITGLTKTLDIHFEERDSLLFIQKVLGQMAFYPPTVAGWPEGKNWIDSSSLIFRMHLPEAIFKASEVSVEAKDDGDIDTEHLAKRKTNNIQAEINWSTLLNSLATSPKDIIIDQLAVYLLQMPISAKQRSLIEKKVAQSTTQEELIKSLTLHLITLPEYQLC